MSTSFFVKRMKWISVLLFIPMIILSSCSVNQHNPKEVSDSFMSYLKKGNYGSAYKLGTPSMKNSISKEQYIQLQKSYENLRGNIKLYP